MNARFELARVTIELRGPARTSGQEMLSPWDAAYVADANGLPTIPGTSLAGILRHAYADLVAEDDPHDGAKTRQLFGFQEGDAGATSAVAVSFAQVHGSHDGPVPFRGLGDAPDDEVLDLLRQGVLRDHVRLSDRGVADERGKFDELLIPVGARFTFELQVASRQGAGAEQLKQLLGLLQHPRFRVGASGRRGHGRIEVVQVLHRSFDLGRTADREALARLPVSLAEPLPNGLLSPLEVPVVTLPGWRQQTVVLRPLDFWMFGGGQPGRKEHEVTQGEDPKYADRVPVAERRISWTDGRGRVTDEEAAPHYLPGSSIKGALRHRAELHFRRRKGLFAGNPAAVDIEDDVAALFGSVKDDEGGRPGRLYVDDGVVVGERSGIVEHVSLDRFTMGPMDGLLFSEAPLWAGPPMKVEVAVDLRGAEIDEDLLGALGDALDDLREGRLALGAHGSRGYGYFEGPPLGREWLEGGAA